jgi:Family of unknown function (DUF5989)
MSWITKTTDRASITAEFIGFLWERKLWWMIPMVLVLVVFGLLIVFAQTSPLAPFIYTLF